MGPTTDNHEMRRAWRHQWVTEVAPAIAAELSKLDRKLWAVDPQEPLEGTWDRNPVVRTAQGERFVCSLDDVQKRVAIHGIYGILPDGHTWMPKDAGVTDETPRMDANKPPATLAADIVRRFLRDYRACLVLYRDRCESMTQHYSGIAVTAREVAAASGGTLLVQGPRHIDRGQPQDRAELRLNRAYEDQLDIRYGDIEVTSADSVTLKLHGNKALGLAFAKMLAETLRQRKETA